MDFLEGDYEILNEQGSDVLVFADFGKAGLKRSALKLEEIKDKSNVAAYGVLGSVRGIHLVVRNTLALKNTINLILVGKEIMPFFSFTAMMLLKQQGIDDRGNIIGFREYIKEKYNMLPLITEVELTKDIVKWFQEHINVVWIDDIKHYNGFNYDKIKENRYKVANIIREKNRKENKSKNKFKVRISDVMVGSHIYEETIEDAHKLALLQILFSGHETDSQYGKTKEIINMMITVKNPYNEVFANKLYENYGKDLVSPSLDSDTYTYGRLLCDYHGFNQINAIIKRLKYNLEDRAALASLWMPQKHLAQKSNQPCLSLVHVLIRNNKINLTAYIRSNDMFKAWPVNVAGLAYVNYYVWDKLKEEYEGLELGYITTISSSAHIYEDDWKSAWKKALNYEKDFIQDKFGYFILGKEGDYYVAKVYENSGRMLGEIKDRCHISLRKKLNRIFSLTSEHAGYIGEVLEGLAHGGSVMER